MRQINPTQIANRIGRIVFATIVASVFVGILSQIGGFTWGESATSPWLPLEWYIDAAFEIAVGVVLLAFVVPIVMVVYWGLSSRVQWVRKWQVMGTGTVLVALALAGVTDGLTLEVVTDTVAFTAYGLSILAAVALVETLFAGRPSKDITSKHVATGTGVLVVAFLVLVPVVAVGSAAAGVVLPTDDPSPVD
ncbi:hypothetical protein [Natronorubrum sp. FCH18a]|uniref:hypothetical protein n=1 Tax=Natronorubrum sp. FCH18a TaxID=3447018 RepID=UPI003F51146F